MAKRHPSASSRSQRNSTGTSLVDWRQPERNVHILDWRQRAHEFGLNPVDDETSVDAPIAAPVERLIEEEEPEAFDEQPVDTGEQVESESEEVHDAADVDETTDARVVQEDVDLVRVYLRTIGIRKLLKAHEEQAIGRKIEVARG